MSSFGLQFTFHLSQEHPQNDKKGDSGQTVFAGSNQSNAKSLTLLERLITRQVRHWIPPKDNPKKEQKKLVIMTEEILLLFLEHVRTHSTESQGTPSAPQLRRALGFVLRLTRRIGNESCIKNRIWEFVQQRKLGQVFRDVVALLIQNRELSLKSIDCFRFFEGFLVNDLRGESSCFGEDDLLSQFFFQNQLLLVEFKNFFQFSGFSQILFKIFVFPNFDKNENSFETLVQIILFLVYNGKSTFLTADSASASDQRLDLFQVLIPRLRTPQFISDVIRLVSSSHTKFLALLNSFVCSIESIRDTRLPFEVSR